MIETNSFFEYLSPLRYFSPSEYQSFWHMLLQNIFYGFWAKLLASVCLVLSFWYGVYRQRFMLGTAFFLMTMAAAYLGGALKTILWWGH